MNRSRAWLSDRAEDWRDADWMERGAVIGIAVLAGILVLAVSALVYNGRAVTGTITGKDFTPAHTVQTTRCAIQPNGQCAIVVVPEYRPDDWTVTVAPDDGSANVTRSVPEPYWNTVQVGDRWADK